MSIKDLGSHRYGNLVFFLRECENCKGKAVQANPIRIKGAERLGLIELKEMPPEICIINDDGDCGCEDCAL